MRETLKEKGYWIMRGIAIHVLDGIFLRAPDHCRRAAAQIAALTVEPLTGLADLLPSRKAWSGRDGEESSDYVDGWNDALDTIERAAQGAVKTLADKFEKRDD